MSHEAPNFLSTEQHEALEDEINRVAEVAKEADRQHQGDLMHRNHNGWVDIGHDSVRMMGQMFGSHRVEHQYGRFGNNRDARTDTRIKTDGKDIHSYSDRRYGGVTRTEMKVSRNGREKSLRSENPAVFNMLTRIALSDIREKAQADIDKTAKKAA